MSKTAADIWTVQTPRSPIPNRIHGYLVDQVAEHPGEVHLRLLVYRGSAATNIESEWAILKSRLKIHAPVRIFTSGLQLSDPQVQGNLLIVQRICEEKTTL